MLAFHTLFMQEKMNLNYDCDSLLITAVERFAMRMLWLNLFEALQTETLLNHLIVIYYKLPCF